MASREVFRYLKEMIQTHKPNVLGLLEPKISGMKADGICNKLGFDECVRVEAIRFSGDIWILWKNSIHAKVITTHPQFVLLQVRELNQEPWLLSIVYGSPTHGLRKHLWNSLNTSNLRLEGSWLAVGDFNTITTLDEISDSDNFSQRRCAGFTN